MNAQKRYNKHQWRGEGGKVAEGSGEGGKVAEGNFYFMASGRFEDPGFLKENPGPNPNLN